MKTLEVYGVLSSFLLIVTFNSVTAAVKLANSSNYTYNIPPVEGIILFIMLPLGTLVLGSMLTYFGRETNLEKPNKLLKFSKYLYGLCLVFILFAIIFTGHELYITASDWMKNLR